MLRKSRRNFAFTWVKSFFHRLLQWFVMIAVNSDDFHYLSYSNLSPCFSELGYCRNSNLLMAGTVDNTDTVQNSGWCWFWIVKAIMQYHCCFRWKQYSPPVKADFLRDFSSLQQHFSSLQQHPMLSSAYLKEPTPQSSAGSKLRPQQTEVSQRGSIF